MINKTYAVEIREHALKAISELAIILNSAEKSCCAEDHELIKRGVGLSIGKIQTELIDLICMHYPELDDL